MSRTPLQLIGLVALLALAVTGGWLATTRFQSTVPIVPGVQGCWRLEGSQRQRDCLAAEFMRGASLVADGTSGREREQAVITYVRRAERLAAQDSRLADGCHTAMHDLGRREGAVAARAERVPTFPEASTQLCTAGYVHGLAEGYVAGSPLADVGRTHDALCRDPEARSGCAHGLGHAILRAEPAKEWTSRSAASAARCAELPSSSRDSCQAGVFMELAMRTEPEPVPTASFVEACRAVDDLVALNCWPYLGTSITVNDAPADTVPGWCARAPLPAQFQCIDGYGRMVGVRGVDACATASARKELRMRCVDGAIALQVGSGHVSAAAARRQCRKLGSDGLRAHCTGAVGRYARGREKVEAAAT